MQLKNNGSAPCPGALGKTNGLDDLIANLMQDELIASLLNAPPPSAPPAPPAPSFVPPAVKEEKREVEPAPVKEAAPAPPEEEPAEEAAPPLPEAQPEEFSVRLESRAAPKESVITERQLRALSRKHLLIMVRDIEKELRQAKEEKESLFLAYNAGLSQRQAQVGGNNYAGRYHTRAS